MPKLNILHLYERLQERLEKLEAGEEIDARDLKALLNTEQQGQLDIALSLQKELRKKYRQPKTEEKKIEIGWKTIREVRIDVYKQAIGELKSALVDDVKELQKQREIKAARIYLDAYCKAGNEGKNADSAGKIALARGGFKGNGAVRLTNRDKEVREMEERLKKELEMNVGSEEKEQLALQKEHKRGLKRPLE